MTSPSKKKDDKAKAVDHPNEEASKAEHLLEGEWKTEGHPWVDNNLQVSCSFAAPTSKHTTSTTTLTGPIVAFGAVDESQRKPALGRVLLEPPPQPPVVGRTGATTRDVVLAVDLTGAEIQKMQTEAPSSQHQQQQQQQGEGTASAAAAASAATTTVLKIPTAGFPSATMVNNVQERYNARLEQYMHESILPPLVALAALEESTLQLIQQRIAQEDAEAAVRHNNAKNAGGSSNNNSNNKYSTAPHPPHYYTKPPNQYLSPPQTSNNNNNNNNSSSSRGNGANDEDGGGSGDSNDPTKQHLSSTPSAWLSRIKLGCQQAYSEYLTQQQHEQQLLQLYQSQIMANHNAAGMASTATDSFADNNSSNSSRRSSSRIARIATEQWEQQKEHLESRQRKTRSATNAETNSGGGLELYLKGHRIASFLQHHQWEQEQEQQDNDDDNDNDKEKDTIKAEEKEGQVEEAKDAEETAAADDGEDAMEVEEEEEEEVEEMDEEEEVEEEDFDLFNPYLKPSFGDVLKWLKKVRMEDIQNAIPHWCQESTNRSSHKAKRKSILEEEELDNVLEVDVLPLDTIVLGIPEEKRGSEAESDGEQNTKDVKMEDGSTPESEKKTAAEPASLQQPAAAMSTPLFGMPPLPAHDPGSPPLSEAKAVEPPPPFGLPPMLGSIPEDPVEVAKAKAPEASDVLAKIAPKPEGAAEKPPSAKEVELAGASQVQDVAMKDADDNGHKKAEVKTEENVTSSNAVAIKAKPETSNGSVKKEEEKKQQEKSTAAKSDRTEQVQQEKGPSKENLILQWEVPSSVEKAPSKKQVYKHLQTLDQNAFGKYKFSLRRLDEEMERLQDEQLLNQLPDEERYQKQLEEQIRSQEAERLYKQRKAWDTWRFKGIHGGYTAWPKWQQAVSEWQKERNAKEATTNGGTVAEGQAPTDQIEADRAKAMEIIEQENAGVASDDGPGTRRTRRKAANAGEPVYYGSSSSLTHKQLLDLILRLCSEKSAPPTVLQLQAIVAEDGSTDPVKRLQNALGKLVWKRNQLGRLAPDANMTDLKTFESLLKGSLLRVSVSPSKDPTSTEAPAKEIVAASADKKIFPEPTKAEQEALLQYIRHLHQTELRLRKALLQNLSEIPIPIVATAADERKNSSEAMDNVDFEDQSTIEWKTQGHKLIGANIFRPRQIENTNDLSTCEWFTIHSYSPSIASQDTGNEEQNPGLKEPPLVERRMRFRAAPYIEDEDVHKVAFKDEEFLILTEAQVHAGMKAAGLEEKQMKLEEEEEKKAITTHPFGGSGVCERITLYPVVGKGERSDPVHYTVVGHDTVLGDQNKERVYRILVLPDGTKEHPTPTAVWASLDISDDTEIRCTLEGAGSKTYRIQQSDFHPESQAFAECRNIVNFLEKNPKATPFLEPVDHVALGIPDYPKIVTNPMDISTVAEKLENGHYSNVPPKQTAGRSPVARMLNGPFRTDVELIFDNAMLFNPPKDWIHEHAAALKKAVTKKIDSIASSADQKFRRSGRQQKQSIYLDEDSDADMYEYESDNDDDDFTGGGRRKRKRGKGRSERKNDDNSTRAMEHSVRLQKTLSETLGLRGTFANFPIDNDAAAFALPPKWNCRRKLPASKKADDPVSGEDEKDGVKPEAKKNKLEEELSDLVELHRHLEENEASGLRRSTRTHTLEESRQKGGKKKLPDWEYFMLDEVEREHLLSSDELSRMPQPSTRHDVEFICEKLHDSLYAKLYEKLSGSLQQSEALKDEGEKLGIPVGSFVNGSFPPFLGRVIPVSSVKPDDISWEIRHQFQVPALRWVIRGLIQSGHLGEVEPLEQESLSSGVIITNHCYYADKTLEPFEILDAKELSRRRRANKEEDESSEDEVELSEYEKLRAERVARNTERLKALGLA